MDIDKEIDSLLENLNEMMHSAAVVKGKPFADAVAIHFESLQLSEHIGNLSGMLKATGKFNVEFVDDVTQAMARTLCSIVSHGLPEMSEKDFKESIDMGQALYKRRVELVEKLNKAAD